MYKLFAITVLLHIHSFVCKTKESGLKPARHEENSLAERKSFRTWFDHLHKEEKIQILIKKFSLKRFA